jgi:hypothetical protein
MMTAGMIDTLREKVLEWGADMFTIVCEAKK